MNVMNYFDFCPDIVERFDDICMAAFNAAGFVNEEIQKAYERMYDELDRGFKEQIESRKPMEILIGIIGAETTMTLGERFLKEDFDYVNNGAESCLLVNGKKYVEGKIFPLFKNEYPEVDFKTCDIELSNASSEMGRNGVWTDFDVKFDADTLEKVLRRGAFDEELIKNAVNNYENADIVVRLHRCEDDVSLDLETRTGKWVSRECAPCSYIPLFASEAAALADVTKAAYEKEYIKVHRGIDENARHL